MLAVPLILAGCGGAGSSKWQEVQGDGFVYNAPAAWKLSGAAATQGSVDRTEVLVFRLLRPYERSRRPAIARELDRVAAGLGTQVKGNVSPGRWLEVGGLDARTYSISFAGKSEEITFALDGRREYQLLCRRPAGADDAPCEELQRSFHAG